VILAANNKALSSPDGLRRIVGAANGQLKLKIEGRGAVTINLGP
jgi:hypothetical protein